MAHNLRGLAAALGAREMERAAHELERAAGNGERARLHGLIWKLEAVAQPLFDSIATLQDDERSA